MYKGNEGWLRENLDWKQLGLMINWLISDDCYDYHQLREGSVSKGFAF